MAPLLRSLAERDGGLSETPAFFRDFVRALEICAAGNREQDVCASGNGRSDGSVIVDRVNTAGASRLLGVCPERVRQLARDEVLPGCLDRGRWLFERGDVEDLAAVRAAGG